MWEVGTGSGRREAAVAGSGCVQMRRWRAPVRGLRDPAQEIRRTRALSPYNSAIGRGRANDETAWQGNAGCSNKYQPYAVQALITNTEEDRMIELKRRWDDLFAGITGNAGGGAILCLAVTFGVLFLNTAPASADDLEVKLVSIKSPVPHEEMNTLVVQTTAGATCSGDIHWQGQKGGGPLRGALNAKPSNDAGIVRWTWRVSGVAGHRDVEVNCTAGDRKGTLHAGFEVT
jgi:hypothetical protein